MGLQVISVLVQQGHPVTQERQAIEESRAPEVSEALPVFLETRVISGSLVLKDPLACLDSKVREERMGFQD